MHRPRIVLLLVALVLAMLAPAFACGQARAASGPTLQLSTDTLLMGSMSGSITASGSGFTPNNAVTLKFDSATVGTATTNASGSFTSGTLAVPVTSVGEHRIIATDASNLSADSLLYVAGVALSTSSALAGTQVTATLQGLAPGQPVAATLGGQTISPAQAQSSAAGQLSFTFAVPYLPAGAQQLQVRVGSAQQPQLTVPFTVAAPTLSLSATSLNAGGTLTVSGAGYPANATLAVKLDNAALGTVVSSSVGAISYGYTIPATTAAGQHQILVVDGAGHTLAMGMLTVNAVTPARIAVSPSTGIGGTNVTVTGAGFGNAETVRITLNGAQLTAANTNAQGQFAVSVPLPQTLGAGAISLVATGDTSHTTASVAFNAVQAGLSISPTSGVAGSRIAIAGRGFSGNERVAISVNGTLISALAADTAGNFTAALTLPATVGTGTLTITATGESSHKVAGASFSVTAAERITLNVQGQQAGKTVTIYSGGAFTLSGTGYGPNEVLTISVAGHELQVIRADSQGNFANVKVTIPSSIAAGSQALVVTGQSSHRAGTLGLSVVARPSASLTFTPSTFTPGKVVQIKGAGFQPGELVQIAIAGGSPFLTPTADANGNFILNAVLPGGLSTGAVHITAIGAASHATVQTAVQLTAPAPAPIPALTTSSTWYFAGGRTDAGFSDQIAVLNPNNRTIQGTITFYYGMGQTRAYPFSLRADARATYNAGQILGTPDRVAAMIQANGPIAAARTTGRSSEDRMASGGVAAPSRTWYMAEGYTGLTFQEELNVFNPGNQTARVHISWPLFNGKPAVSTDLTLAAHSRQTISVNRYVPKASHATVVTSDQPIVAARTMYFGTRLQGAHSKPGVTAPNSTIYFAEGSTANGFEEYLTMLNPSSAIAAHVTATFYNRTGTLVGTRTITIDPMHRGNVKVNDVVTTDAVSAMLRSDQPIVAERSMYFGAPNGGSAGGTVVLGESTLANAWAFATGNTQPGNAEFELLFNPSRTPNQVQATYYTDSGQMVQRTFTLAPTSRTNIDLNLSVQGLPRGYHGLVLRSLNGVPFIAEQAIYDSHITNGAALIGTPVNLAG